MTLTRWAREQALSCLVLLDSLLLPTLVVVLACRGAVIEALLLSHDSLLAFLQEIQSFSLLSQEIFFHQHNLQFCAQEFYEESSLLGQAVMAVNDFRRGAEGD